MKNGGKEKESFWGVILSLWELKYVAEVERQIAILWEQAQITNLS